MHPGYAQPGMRVVFPQQLPVVGPPAPVPTVPVGNTGPQYGTQSFRVWAAGETDARQVIDTLKATALWRISVTGRVRVTFDYGTSQSRALIALQAPVVITIPGQCTVTAEPLDDDGTTCVVTLTEATAGALSQARKLADASVSAVALDDAAVRYVALTASTLTISGVTPVAVPALSVVPLVAGSSLLTGSGFQEFEA
jgi:hypothetical protein